MYWHCFWNLMGSSIFCFSDLTLFKPKVMIVEEIPRDSEDSIFYSPEEEEEITPSLLKSCEQIHMDQRLRTPRSKVRFDIVTTV